MSSPSVAASQSAYQCVEHVERSGVSISRPEARPRSSRMWLCLPLAVFPALVMAKAASPYRKGLLRFIVFAVVSALYIGGIASFTLSSTVHDSVLITDSGDPVTATPLVLFFAWAPYTTTPFLTVLVDLVIWFRWALTGLDEEPKRVYIANNASVALIGTHLVCHILITVMMMIESCRVKAAAWNPSHCGVFWCGCCCPHWWLASAVAVSNKEKLSHDEVRSSDELPAYNV